VVDDEVVRLGGAARRADLAGEGDVLAQRAEVVPEVERPGRLDAGGDDGRERGGRNGGRGHSAWTGPRRTRAATARSRSARASAPFARVFRMARVRSWWCTASISSRAASPVA